MYIILAISDDNVIGENNKLPWRIPYDLLWFKMHTYNKPVVMGRKTWQSLRKKLKNRTNIVLSSSYQEGADIQFNDLKTLKTNMPTGSMVIGGAQLAKEFFEAGNYIILTRIHILCANDNSTVMVLPNMKTLWKSKPMAHKHLNFTFSINKIT